MDDLKYSSTTTSAIIKLKFIKNNKKKLPSKVKLSKAPKILENFHCKSYVINQFLHFSLCKERQTANKVHTISTTNSTASKQQMS